MNGFVDALLGGWQTTTIISANSGLPIDIAYTLSAANDVTGRIPDYRREAIMRPNPVGDPTGSSGADMLNAYFNKSAFAIPVASSPFGGLGRNSLRGPDFWQWDLGVDKNFRLPIREGMALQSRSEFFNVLNHTNFGFPDANISDAAHDPYHASAASDSVRIETAFLEPCCSGGVSTIARVHDEIQAPVPAVQELFTSLAL